MPHVRALQFVQREPGHVVAQVAVAGADAAVAVAAAPDATAALVDPALLRVTAKLVDVADLRRDQRKVLYDLTAN